MKDLKFIFVFVCAFLMVATLQAQSSRTISSFDAGWKFYSGGRAYAETENFNDTDWQTISLPHSWNVSDPFDDDLTYKRGISWYRKTFIGDASQKNKNIYLWFEGANQLATVYVNGYFIAVHKGGYTGFTVDVTKYLNWEKGNENIVAVQVSNAHDPFLAPVSVGYASYGGIYRDVWMVTTDKVHFTSVNTNSAGVFINTPEVSEKKGTIHFRTNITNDEATAVPVSFVNEIRDATGKLLSSSETKETILANSNKEIVQIGNDVLNPHLWSPTDPYLYTVTSKVVVGAVVKDEVVNNIGFRWFRFEPGNGFFLNGKKLTLHGTNRHQDLQGKADALSPEDHRRDMQFIKDMGANFVRLAHYPQAPDVLRLADELGLLVWEEIPVVDCITPDQQFLENSEHMIKEMITQGYNHPSVILWGSNNEVFLHGQNDERISKQTDTAYVAIVKKFVVKLDSTVRAEDPSRYSTMAMHGSNDYQKYGLDTISQVAGFNIYDGWYGGVTETFGPAMDSKKTATRNVFVSEYGAEGEVRLNTEKPERFDYTGQYQQYFHQEYLRQINARPWMAGTAIWNEFDFSQPNIGGPQSHRNQKGMITWDRKPKDVYYFYKANWNPDPMVYIASRNWQVRGGAVNASSTINVYSNAEEVTLFVNGVSQKAKKGNDVHVFTWQVKLQDGKNEITATAKINKQKITDNFVIDYKAYAANLAGFKTISINVGSNAQYLDASGNVWNEDRAYAPGSFGYLSGENSMVNRKMVIKNTKDEPLYYSFREGIAGYKFDVPDGKYRVTLYFAEPVEEKVGARIFDVNINDISMMNNLDLTKENGLATTAQHAFEIESINNKGIQIQFIPVKGKTVLNGLKLEKI